MSEFAICAKCAHSIVSYGKFLCHRPDDHVNVDPITGLRSISRHNCLDRNLKGKCQHFKLQRFKRIIQLLKWRPW